MRLTLLLIVAMLGGCTTIREGLGGTAKAEDAGKPVLPGGLGGDKANAAYTTPPQL